ncbi:hypothetical protein [Treponema sp. R6D11]
MKEEMKERVLEFGKKYYIYLILMAVCLIGWIAFAPNKKETPISNSVTSNSNYARELETKLEDMVSCMYGAGEAKVTITLSSQTKQILAKDEKTTTDTQIEKSDRMQKETAVAVVNGSPIIIEEELPKIAGVCVIARGAGDKKTAENIRSAVASSLGIREGKVAVFQKR